MEPTEMKESGDSGAAEFADAKPVTKFHRFRVQGDGQSEFGLLGADGINNYFSGDPDVIAGVAIELANLAGVSQRMRAGDPNAKVAFPFETSHVLWAVPGGGDSNGSVQFSSITPEGTTFTTLLGPELTAQMVGALLSALDSMPNPPQVRRLKTLSAGLPGKPHEGEDTEVHFGQRYRTKILNILGLLVIRANLLELSMVSLLAALLEISAERAEAIFFSSQNMKARSDMLRATAATAGLNGKQQTDVIRVIDKIDNICRRRNQLVHGHWSFSGEKFSVRERKPLANKKVQDVIETFKSIEAIVGDFHDVALLVDIETLAIAQSRGSAKDA